MSLIDQIIKLTVAFSYNILTHTTISSIYQNMSYIQRHTYMINTMIISSIIGLILIKIMGYDNIISKGIFIGSIMLVLTAILSSFYIQDNIKLGLIAIMLFLISYITIAQK